MSSPDHLRDRLARELVAWFVSVRPDGRPHAVPMWFLWDEPMVHLFSVPGSQKLRNVAANPNVSLTLELAVGGTDIVVVEGVAEVDDDGLSAAEQPGFAEKYARFMGGGSPSDWAGQFSQPIRVTVSRVFGWTKGARGPQYVELRF